MGSDPQYAKWPLLPLSQHVFTLTNAYASKTSQQAALKALQDAITEDKMAPFYRYLAHPIDGVLHQVGEGGAAGPGKPLSRKSSLVGMIATKATAHGVHLPWDEALYARLLEDNEKELAQFQKEEDDAEEQAGETEVLAAKGRRADFWARVGDKEKAITAYDDVFEKTGILGSKIDLVLAIIRMGLFYGDKQLVKKYIERAKGLVETGGDWDRRNRLKAYEGLHLLTVRSHSAAAPLLLDSLSTFTSYELCTYSNLVVYSVLAGSVSLKRVDFKSKVVDAPEIKAILGDGEDKLLALSGALSAGPGADDTPGTNTPKAATTAVNLTTLGSSAEQTEAEAAIDFSPLALLVSSLYNGNYKTFFQSLASVEEQFLNQDRYLHEHKTWFIREMRLRAYQQLLQSYRVVGLDSMANDFGVTVDFLDRDLARFIAAGRIPCTIDRVSGKGVIETNRPDDKNKQYQDVVRQGDQLITKLQKYGQAVRLRGSERA
ncbi:proteasome regulatory particle, non-ATPase-like protein [Cordyceps militaris CM01]|uniref:Proteasome regulatory particle, non-ATPase-like protein n=1 Tax=Cordyceps militaris (strain CM01) TaxID=983644 RepID=G3JFF9_CORMM|nr:proteasome regulatory particle, non-ATPase-like protein [Cordyceps militaris CM01]EGX93149.1 proteasome regulatory particle, non-ATPase-like protein [Cordyceps militaris CM01]